MCDVLELVQNATANITCEDGRVGLRNSSGVILCYNETSPGTHVEYMCDNGYDLISTEKLVLECQVNGLWDQQPAITCRTQQGKVCGNDAPLSHSQFTPMQSECMC